MKRSIMLILLLGVILLISAQEVPLRKAWKVDWEGNYIHTSDNCVIALWEDTDAGDTDIYAQKINAFGIEQWPQPIILAGGPGVQEIIACASTSDNNFVFLYESSGHGFEYGMFIQKVTSHGQVLWGENGVQISLDRSFFIFGANLMANEVGGAYIIYNNISRIIGQNLDSFGNQLWPAGGITLINSSQGSMMLFDSIVSDGQGGFIININKQVGNSRITELTRFSAEGTVIGPNPMLAPEAFPGSFYSILQDTLGDYVLWNVSFYPTFSIVLHRMDSQGNLLMSSPTITDLSISYYPYNRPSLQALADGGLMLSYGLHLSQDYKLMLVRFDSSCALIWNLPVLQSAIGEHTSWSCLQLSVTDAGGAWLSWIYSEEEYGGRELRAQYVDPFGIAAWGDDGIVLSGLSREIRHPILSAISDQALFLWYEEIDGQAAVRRQVMSTAAVPALDAGGAALFTRLAGIASLMEVLTTQDKYLIFWADSRNGWSNIYYQLCDAAMNPLLEPGGRPLYPPQNGYINAVQIQNMPDGKVAVLYHHEWNHTAGTLPSYVQIIDSSGNQIYPGMGIAVCEDTALSIYTQMSSCGDELFFVWPSGLDSQSVLKGQRIFDGQLIWGPQGKVLVTRPDIIKEDSVMLEGRYIVFNTEGGEHNFLKCLALKIDANGDLDPAWPEEGLEIVIDPEATRLYAAFTALLDDDLVVLATSLYASRAQRINAEGTRLWTDAGIPLPSYAVRDILGGEALTLIYQTDYDATDLFLLKIAGDGSLPYGADGHVIARDVLYSRYPKLFKFANDSMGCTWSSVDYVPTGYRDVFLRYISPQGMPLGDAPERLCDAWLEQENVRAAVIGNSAMVAWTDGRAGILDGEYFVSAIYATRIDASPIGISDPVLPVPPTAILAQNYPNPFNPETNIAFQLPRSGATSLNVYNMKGQLVRKLYANQPLAAGKHTVRWDGCDEQGRGVSSGIYLYRLTFADQAVTRKMLMAK